MNIVNRVIMIVASLLVFAFGSITFLLLTGIVVPQNSYLQAILAAYRAFQALALLNGTAGNTLIIISLLVALVGLVVLILELWGPVRQVFRKREAAHYLIRHDALGEVTVGRSTVRDWVQHDAETVPGVVHAQAAVREGKDGLRVATRVSLAWNADAPMVGQVLQERIRESVQTHLGLPVSEVRVTAQTAPLAKESARPRVA